jgi:hypothetical protein
MATRLKTVHYAFPTLAALTNNTQTSLTTFTIYLPETGTKTFRSVVAHITMDDILTAAGGNISTKTFDLRLGAAAYTSVANANVLQGSGENASILFAVDYTSHFQTNWTGASMGCDFRLTINQATGTTLGMVNVCVNLEITYEYDDTSTTHVKTVMIPLDAPVGTIATAATTYDTIPALDTYLPEASKVYRQIHVVIQGNEARNTATTDHTMTLRVGTANVTTGNYEGALASDRWIRYIWEMTSVYPNTAATQTWQPTATVARFNHFQAYLVVTYEFDATASTSIMNSVMLATAMASPMGGAAATDFQRSSVELWIQEPGTITTNRVAFYGFWNQVSNITGKNLRIGTGSFVTYTDASTVLCGCNGAMVRNDAAFTLARGKNTLNFDAYRTDTTDLGFNVSGYFIVNYTSGKATAGVGAHNQTIFYSILQNGTAAAAGIYSIAAFAPVIPEVEHFISQVGVRIVPVYLNGVPHTTVVQVERLAAEGGIEWENIYHEGIHLEENGIYYIFAQDALKDHFIRWTGDTDPIRFNIETARRYRIIGYTATALATAWYSMCMVFTYHSISYSVAGDITGSAGGTVNITLHDDTTGAKLRSTSRTGNGAYTLTWFDNTRNVYTSAFEDGTHIGRSAPSLAA